MQEIISDIQAKPVYACSVCGHRYDTMEEAKNCADMGLWVKDFDSAAYLWRWNIFKPRVDHPSVVAIVSNSARASFIGPDNDSCNQRAVVVFEDAASTKYWTFKSRIKIITLGILEGFEQYHLIPPVQYMRNIPDAKVSEIMETLRQAFMLREREFVDGGMSIAKSWNALAASEFVEFTRPLWLASGEKTLPFIDTSFLPETGLISGKKLYKLEKYIPGLSAKLEW